MALFELPETEQEIYDICKQHLLTQNKLCAVAGLCRYRYNGLKCAAGVLIPEEHYDSSFEDMTWESLVRERDFPGEHSQLILSLQKVHDTYLPEEWEEELKRVAWRYQLKG